MPAAASLPRSPGIRPANQAMPAKSRAGPQRGLIAGRRVSPPPAGQRPRPPALWTREASPGRLIEEAAGIKALVVGRRQASKIRPVRTTSHPGRHGPQPVQASRRRCRAWSYFAIMFLIAPTITVRTAPPTPPPTTWATRAPTSRPPAAGAPSAVAMPGSPMPIAANTWPEDQAADRTRDRVARRSKTILLDRSTGGVAAKGAGDDLDDEADNAFHVTAPGGARRTICGP